MRAHSCPLPAQDDPTSEEEEEKRKAAGQHGGGGNPWPGSCVLDMEVRGVVAVIV